MRLLNKVTFYLFYIGLMILLSCQTVQVTKSIGLLEKRKYSSGYNLHICLKQKVSTIPKSSYHVQDSLRPHATESTSNYTALVSKSNTYLPNDEIARHYVPMKIREIGQRKILDKTTMKSNNTLHHKQSPIVKITPNPEVVKSTKSPLRMHPLTEISLIILALTILAIVLGSLDSVTFLALAPIFNIAGLVTSSIAINKTENHPENWSKLWLAKLLLALNITCLTLLIIVALFLLILSLILF